MRTVDRGTGALLLIALVGGATLAACSPLASKGTMPPPGPDGEVDASSAPDFLAVAGQDVGIVGYARKEDVLEGGDRPFPVFGEGLRTVVGQMVPGKGFVPVGVDPATVPTFRAEVAPSLVVGTETSGNVVLYVRNDADKQAWITVLVDGQPWNSTGFSGQNMGAGCYAMPTGSQLVLLDGSPQQSAVSVERQLYVRDQEIEPPALWITIDQDGAVKEGTGVPLWWGPAQTC